MRTAPLCGARARSIRVVRKSGWTTYLRTRMVRLHCFYPILFLILHLVVHISKKWYLLNVKTYRVAYIAYTSLHWFCFKYKTERRKNAHANPMAQYTLVNIRGKNSIEAALDFWIIPSSGHEKKSTEAHSIWLEGGGSALRVMTGKIVTRSWSNRNPAK